MVNFLSSFIQLLIFARDPKTRIFILAAAESHVKKIRRHITQTLEMHRYSPEKPKPQVRVCQSLLILAHA